RRFGVAGMTCTRPADRLPTKPEAAGELRPPNILRIRKESRPRPAAARASPPDAVGLRTRFCRTLAAARTFSPRAPRPTPRALLAFEGVDELRARIFEVTRDCVTDRPVLREGDRVATRLADADLRGPDRARRKPVDASDLNAPRIVDED